MLQIEADAIHSLAQRIDYSACQAVEKLIACTGRVIVTGMGKMGLIGRKASATFCSTGTPSIFLHPAEAAHGDLGIVNGQDLLLVLSSSGETRELLDLLPFMKRFGVSIIGLMGMPASSIGQQCDVVIDVGVAKEADPISIAPTSSTTTALAMCDALAVSLMQRRGFTKEQFAIFHPGGNLGARLLVRVSDIMKIGSRVPTIESQGHSLENAIQVISSKGLGAVFVVDVDQKIRGIVTDGDLRRIIEKGHLNRDDHVWDEPVSKHMIHDPKSIQATSLAAEALRLMEDYGITILPVTDESEKITGVIHLHDLIRAGLA
ncbi:MAG: KpsF/GutQ family sugar-phosphate isomerase [Planctomycetota bacterium]